MLSALILLLLISGALAWYTGQKNPQLCRWIATGSLGMLLLITLPFLPEALSSPIQSNTLNPGILNGPDHRMNWLAFQQIDWIPRFGISFLLALDGLSLLLVILTLVLGLVAVAASWNEITERVGFFYFNLLWSLAGVLGVFMALDLFLFFFFWEIMLVPMYFLIGIWGHENRRYAAIKFFIFTQASSLLMLISILALAFQHQQQMGVYSFNYFDLLGSGDHSLYGFWLMLGFFIAFVVKLPAFPLHTWLPDAHTQAPTGGSIILAGVLLKTGAYGLIRFLIPLFPGSLDYFAPYAMAIGVIGILYAAILAFTQTDLKRLIAYTSISHMGFVLLGVYAWNTLALQGAAMQMLTHGLSAAALFMIAGSIQHRIHTRDLDKMGGFWSSVPKIGCITLFFAMASLGMPGLGNFVGEFLVLIGSFQVNIPMTLIATLGLVAAAVYSLIIIQKAFHGPPNTDDITLDLNNLKDFDRREMAAMGVMIVGLIWMGLYPQPLLDTLSPVFSQLEAFVSLSATVDKAHWALHSISQQSPNELLPLEQLPPAPFPLQEASLHQVLPDRGQAVIGRLP
ncbi:NADH-quinone oxidoreductase subunit M [Motiliproteus sp. MSK22-1]|uniref:NADH-quinone oxidoreductase subunit M n=1 Tax=Motiliproteus sp. MSK22-1 TaxID=1897630 RepID=UPI000975E2E3|nr:NADH-quinone oxidoreductase subunit M [Motiliproteus sp. MSK22-1]OMH36131.1 NADH dehydrogenase [Motiliproteus sp. MSK22-1]